MITIQRRMPGELVRSARTLDVIRAAPAHTLATCACAALEARKAAIAAARAAYAAGVPHPAAGHASLGPDCCSGGSLMIPSGLTSSAIHRARPLTSAPGRGPHPACSVLRAPAGRELLDGGPLSADAPAHRATRVAPDLIERTALEGRESWTTPGGSVSAVGGHGRHAVGTGEVSRAGSSRTSRSSMLNGRNPWLRGARLTQLPQKEEKWVYIGNLDSNILTARNAGRIGCRILPAVPYCSPVRPA